MRSKLRERIARNAAPLLVAYLLVGGAIAYTMVMLPSATYRDEWGFAEFRWAKTLSQGALPLPLDAPPGSSYLKVRDICCSVGSEATAAALARVLHVPLESVYVQGWWAVLLAPALGYALVRQVARPWPSAFAVAAATTLTVGFPYYLVDPRGLMLTTHAAFLLCAWRAAKAPRLGRVLAGVAAAFVTAIVYLPLGMVELAMLVILLLLTRAPRPAIRAALVAPALLVALVPDCALPYVNAILAHPHTFLYPSPAVPYLAHHSVSMQMFAALSFGGILCLTIVLRWRAGLVHRFILAATLAAMAFAVLPFSIHRFFTFVALPLAFALAHAVTQPNTEDEPMTFTLARWAAGAATSVLAVLPRPSFAPRARSALWGVALISLLVMANASAATFPFTTVARYGTFTPDYLEGVQWVAANVEGNFTTDLKFAGAHFAYTGRVNAQQVLDDYDKTGELTQMWYSPNVDATIAVMRAHDSCTLVVTSDLTRVIIVADFYREGVGAKLDQIRASDQFHLLHSNADVSVYQLAQCKELPWPTLSTSASPTSPMARRQIE